MCENCSCRYLTIQMLERPGVTGGQLEVSEVQVEGWARSCGEISVSQLSTQLCFVLSSGSWCLQSSAETEEEMRGVRGSELHQWHRVRHTPRGSVWHPAQDKLRWFVILYKKSLFFGQSLNLMIKFRAAQSLEVHFLIGFHPHYNKKQ